MSDDPNNQYQSLRTHNCAFWDLHELLGNYSLEQMLCLHEERYPYDHNPNLILKNFTDFGRVDNDFEHTLDIPEPLTTSFRNSK
jgi:hypothetical protein